MKIKILQSGVLFGLKKQRVAPQDPHKYSDSKGRFLTAFLPILWMVLFFLIPMIIILKISFSEMQFAIPPFAKFFNCIGSYLIEIKINFKNYISFWENHYYLLAFKNSIVLSFITTIICLLLGYPMAYGIHSAERKTKSLLLLLVSLPFWTSFLIRVYGWMNLLSTNGIVNTTLMKWGIINAPIQFTGNYYIVCLGLVFCYLPFMIFPVYSILEKVDRSYIESAFDLGCSRTKAFWFITFRLTYSGIFSGAILVFATTIGEFIIPELLGGSDVITFGRVLWTEFFTNLDWPMACAFSVIMMFFIILPIFFLQKKAKI